MVTVRVVHNFLPEKCPSPERFLLTSEDCRHMFQSLYVGLWRMFVGHAILSLQGQASVASEARRLKQEERQRKTRNARAYDGGSWDKRARRKSEA